MTIKLASTSDELLQCYALRAAVFMGEQQCPYYEEFDGNDYTATHVVMYVDGEPAGSMRLRWFQSFCKFERCVVLRRYRSPGPVPRNRRMGQEFAGSKGYRKAYLHLQKRHMPMMEKEGFRRVDDRVFVFPTTNTTPSPAISGRPNEHPTVDTEPMVLNRPEDRMDVPGILESRWRCAARMPHAPTASNVSRLD